MNWLRSKLTGGDKKEEEMQDEQQPASSDKNDKKDKKDKGSDDEGEDANLAAEDDCHSCSTPCEEHAQLPEAIGKKISHKVMTGSVKDHKRHFLLATGGSADQWPSEIDRTKYAAAFDKEISNLKKKIGYGCRVTLAEESCMDETGSPLSPSEHESMADIYVFPDMIQFHRVSIEQIPTVLNYILLDKEYNKKGVNERKSADGDEKESTTSNFLPISIPHTRLPHRAYVMICGHKLRDKRCSAAAGILQQEFDRQLQAKDMMEQVHVTKISHVGGHKFAGNVIIYPGGHWFGRVTTCHVQPLLDGYILNAKIPEPIVRGRVELDDTIPRYHPAKSCVVKDW